MNNKTIFDNPVEIKKVCEWTGQSFTVDWKHRKQRFINKEAMYEWRKSQNREPVKCKNCGTSFERYKRILHPRSGRLTEYCSNECNRSSNSRKGSMKNWMIENNPMKSQISRDKIKLSKLKRYGDGNYNNIEQGQQTMLDKYGVHCAFLLPSCKSNGKRISKFQRKEYIKILREYPDAILEHYLKDVKKSVDIFIPSKNKIVECFGDYWHCNPSKCSNSYYNKLVHMTAEDIWAKDNGRIKLLESCGYVVEILWENTNKTFKH
jgi:hypothetical protein